MLYINLRFIFYHSHLRWVKWKMLSQKLWKWIPKAAGFKSPSAPGPGAAPRRSSSPHTTNPLPAAPMPPKPRFSSPKPTNQGEDKEAAAGALRKIQRGVISSLTWRDRTALSFYIYFTSHRGYTRNKCSRKVPEPDGDFSVEKNAFVSAVPPKSINYTIKFWIISHSHLYLASACFRYY